jgi:hypothetical protein
MKTVNRNWHLSRYLCVFLLGVLCALVTSVRAHDPEMVNVVREHTRAVHDLTTAMKGLPKCQ